MVWVQKTSENITYQVTVLNDTLGSSVWTATAILDADDDPVATPTITPVAGSTTIARAQLSGLVAGVKYKLSCLLTLTSGQVLEAIDYVRGLEA